MAVGVLLTASASSYRPQGTLPTVCCWVPTVVAESRNRCHAALFGPALIFPFWHWFLYDHPRYWQSPFASLVKLRVGYRNTPLYCSIFDFL